MAHYDVTLDGDGNPSPEKLPRLSAGDSITFSANGDDAVVCFPDDGLFGSARFEVADGTSVTITAQHSDMTGVYVYSVSVGDLNADCGGHLGSGGELGP